MSFDLSILSNMIAQSSSSAAYLLEYIKEAEGTDDSDKDEVSAHLEYVQSTLLLFEDIVTLISKVNDVVEEREVHKIQNPPLTDQIKDIHQSIINAFVLQVSTEDSLELDIYTNRLKDLLFSNTPTIIEAVALYESLSKLEDDVDTQNLNSETQFSNEIAAYNHDTYLKYASNSFKAVESIPMTVIVKPI